MRDKLSHSAAVKIFGAVAGGKPLSDDEMESLKAQLDTVQMQHCEKLQAAQATRAKRNAKRLAKQQIDDAARAIVRTATGAEPTRRFIHRKR